MTLRLEARIARREAVTAGENELSRLMDEELEIVILDISHRLAAVSESPPEEREELARNIAQAEDRLRRQALEYDDLDQQSIMERSAAILARLDIDRQLASIGGNET